MQQEGVNTGITQKKRPVWKTAFCPLIQSPLPGALQKIVTEVAASPADPNMHQVNGKAYR